jgi:hypothetical protein
MALLGSWYRFCSYFSHCKNGTNSARKMTLGEKEQLVEVSLRRIRGGKSASYQVGVTKAKY